MSKVKNMGLSYILDGIDIILKNQDIVFFCDDVDIAQDFIDRFSHKSVLDGDLKKYLIDNEQHIDPEKLILVLVLNYKENIYKIKKEIEKAKQSYYKSESKESFEKLSKLTVQERIQETILGKLLKLGKGMNCCISSYFFNDKTQKYYVKVFDSREIIDNKKVSSSKNLQRFNYIDSYFKNTADDENGIEYLIQGIILTDLCEVFTDPSIGASIRNMILYNNIISSGMKSKEELDSLRMEKKQEEYWQIVDNAELVGVLPEVKEAIREQVAYLNIDNLLLISAYRLIELLENDQIDSDSVQELKQTIERIYDNLKPNAEIETKLEDRINNTYELMSVKFSAKDIAHSLKHFTSSQYITKEQEETYKKKLNSQEINLSQMNPEEVDAIFIEKDLERLAILSPDNFLYVSSKYNWNNEKTYYEIQKMHSYSSTMIKRLIEEKRLDIAQMVSLYEQGKLPIEMIKQIREEYDIADKISNEKLNSLYQEYIKNPEDNAQYEKYQRYVELYKAVLIDDAQEEQINQVSNKLMEQMIETYGEDEKNYKEAIKDYFNAGLLTLSSIAEWNSEGLIENLYREEIFSLDDLDKLAREQKISSEFIKRIYREIIQNKDLDYDERYAYIKRGFVSIEDILDLYNQNLIFDVDLEALATSGILPPDAAQKAIQSRTKEALERKSTIRLIGLNELTKKNNSIYSQENDSTEYQIKPQRKTKNIIDPNERENFILMLKARKAESDVEEDSPFYDYEFYVIPDESGDIGLNSVVIAERYFEDKNTEEKFAINNATYFFKYKDLMVLGNLKKSEITKERENIVFTSSHTLASEKRNRSLVIQCS